MRGEGQQSVNRRPIDDRRRVRRRPRCLSLSDTGNDRGSRASSTHPNQVDIGRHYSIFADYHHFYLWDHGASPDAPTDYTQAETVRRIKAAPFVVVIQPERNMDVAIEVARSAPCLALDD